VTGKCVGCRKQKPIFKHVAGSQICGPHGLVRKPGVDWCKECWDANVAMNDRYRAEQDAKNAQLLKDMLEGKK